MLPLSVEVMLLSAQQLNRFPAATVLAFQFPDFAGLLQPETSRKNSRLSSQKN
jgi:hypothetical protein